MSRARIAGLGLLALALALAAHWPLRLLVDRAALARLGIGAADLHGPAWRAQARSVRWRGRALGDLDLRLQPAPLLLGQRRLRIQGDGFALTLVQGRRSGLLDATGSWPLQPGLAGLPTSLQAAGLDTLFADGRCLRAGGALTLQVAVPGDAAPLELAGSPRCDGDAWSVALAGRGRPGAGPEADLRIDGAGHWRLDTRLPAADPALAVLAAAAGFQESGGHYRRVDAGTLAGPAPGPPAPPR
ncbi:MAG: type II secretion system protein N [Gammaproteobacteria bacterium]